MNIFIIKNVLTVFQHKLKNKASSEILPSLYKKGKLGYYSIIMISQLEGKIVFSGDRYVVIDVSGVGYKVNATLETLRKINKEKSIVRLWTYLAVRENALDLYGFEGQGDLEFFELLLTVSGIGPKSALAIMNVAPTESIRKAISTGEASYLTKISGIGRKTSEKIVLELRDKLGAWTDIGSPELQEESDAVLALQSLGYSQNEARNALKKVPHEISGASLRVKEALKILGNA